MFLYKFLEDIFAGITEESWGGVGAEDTINEFYTLAVVSYFLEPA